MAAEIIFYNFPLNIYNLLIAVFFSRQRGNNY